MRFGWYVLYLYSSLLLNSITRTSMNTSSGYVSRCCLTYVVAEVTKCKQADIDYRGHGENSSEHDGVMDYDQDRNRPKR